MYQSCDCYCLQYNAGLFLESFSVELVVLAIWKKALQICSSWLTSTSQSELPATSSANKRLVQGGTSSAPNSENNVDFSSLSSVCMWAEQGFILAFDRAEKLSSNIRDMDGWIADQCSHNTFDLCFI